MVNRRLILSTLAATGGAALVACDGGATAVPAPTETVPAGSPTPQPFTVRVQMIPQEARLGTDENVVVRTTFLRFTGGQLRPVSGAQISATATYPSGPQTFTSEITTFPDGRAPDLAIPVAPAARGANVRVEVVMRYQGQEYKQAAGFAVR
ncbi:MAG: hypothetical protein M3442_03965 [Chloroflexota bacterium]|nr:hypothetical protein [Chloroflexota bacterium]